jgi:hypothetical protein
MTSVRLESLRPWKEDVITENPSGDPADELQRFVCFVAAALDVPYAYITGLAPRRGGRRAPGLTVWLARDYGLKFEFAQLYGFHGDAAAPDDHVEALQRLWPQVPGFASVLAAGEPPRPLRDRRGTLLGHLAALDAPAAGRQGLAERLEPLARVAALKLERWAAQFQP